MPQRPLELTSHQDLIDYWRAKLEESQKRYEAAATQYRNLSQGQTDWSSDRALVDAQELKSQALAEYTRVLRIFVDLTLHGQMPEQSAARSDGV